MFLMFHIDIESYGDGIYVHLFVPYAHACARGELIELHMRPQYKFSNTKEPKRACETMI